MQFIFQYPEVLGPDGDMLDSGPVAEFAVAAEAAGWRGFAFTEHPVPGARWLSSGGHQALDPFVALGHVAAVTSELKLLTNLSVGPYRNPFLLAKAATTVDKLSNGRMVLGLGTGYLKGEFHALGVDFDERNVLFDEMLDALALHWSGEPFTYEGTHFNARDVIGLPRPVQQPIPIWIGGNSQLTMRRVAARAQGWLPLLAYADISATTRTPHIGSVELLAEKIASLREQGGARGPGLDVAAAYNTYEIWSPEKNVARHRDVFASMEAAGVTWVIVPGPTEGSRAFIDVFAEHYLKA